MVSVAAAAAGVALVFLFFTGATLIFLGLPRLRLVGALTNSALMPESESSSSKQGIATISVADLEIFLSDSDPRSRNPDLQIRIQEVN
jgi:hypothetical protein